jgi:hypothetical protein
LLRGRRTGVRLDRYLRPRHLHVSEAEPYQRREPVLAEPPALTWTAESAATRESPSTTWSRHRSTTSVGTWGRPAVRHRFVLVSGRGLVLASAMTGSDGSQSHPRPTSCCAWPCRPMAA